MTGGGAAAGGVLNREGEAAGGVFNGDGAAAAGVFVGDGAGDCAIAETESKAMAIKIAKLE